MLFWLHNWWCFNRCQLLGKYKDQRWGWIFQKHRGYLDIWLASKVNATWVPRPFCAFRKLSGYCSHRYPSSQRSMYIPFYFKFFIFFSISSAVVKQKCEMKDFCGLSFVSPGGSVTVCTAWLLLESLLGMSAGEMLLVGLWLTVIFYKA